MKKKHPVALWLHNIRSAHNVGSIFRTADAAGVEKIFLSGYTPCPLDRFGRTQKEIAKTALGAEQSVPWRYYATASSVRRILKKEGWQLVGVEQDTRAVDYRTYNITKPTVLLLGEEVSGIDMKLRTACDHLIEIPMHGTKESLNVSVAAGIVLFTLR